MSFLTKQIGDSDAVSNFDPFLISEVKSVLICRPNHRLGNLLLITPLVQELVRVFPNCKIDLIAKGDLASTIFKNYPSINKIMQLPRKPFKNLISYVMVWISVKNKKYDLVINVVPDSSSGKLLTAFSRGTSKLYSINEENHIAKKPIHALRHFINSTQMNYTSMPTLSIKLSLNETIIGQQLLNKLVKNNNQTICLFTYATNEKCYSESWWFTFYLMLKKSCPDINIIEILPLENISRIGFKAPTFYSSDIREIGSLLTNSALFIGADSGIMHLASASKITTIGLFSVTNPKVYAPYGNNSVSINTNTTSIERLIAIINDILNKNKHDDVLMLAK